MTDEQRASFEQWYAENAFDFAANPIGSRDCGLQRAAWEAALAQAQTWRPIHTAPGFKTPILLRDADGNVVVGKWVYANWEIVGGGGGIFLNPTGWLPLPGSGK